MELNGIGVRRGFDERHDFSGRRPGADMGRRRKRVVSNDQRVIPTDFDRRWKIRKEMRSAVRHGGSQAVDGPERGNDVGSQQGGEALVSETDSEHRDATEDLAQDRQAVRGIPRVAGTR